MASIFNDDESTDDEIGMNLQLAERLRINRTENSNFVEDSRFENSKEFKQYCNMRRKQYAHDGQSSSSSSVEIQNENSLSGINGSDIYHNKKRQNGDKNIEQLANPKRTCLSDRLRRSPEWRDIRKKGNNSESHSKHSKFLEHFHLQSGATSDLFSDKKNEEHVNSLADAEDSDFEVPPKITRNFKKGSQSSKACKNHRTLSPDVTVQFPSKPSTSYFCNKFLESGSEDESKSFVQNGALKGGRQESSDHAHYAKKLLGRKFNRKVLDSDESEDDSSVGVYRCRPLVFTSSDSEDLRQTAPKSKPTGAACNGATSHDHSYGDTYENSSSSRPSRQYKSLRSNQKLSKKTICGIPLNRADSSEGCDHQFLSSDFQRKSTNRPCRTRRSPRTNMTSNLTSNGFTNGNKLSAPVRGRRMSGGERGTRRSASPHHRNLGSQHRSDDNKGNRGRSISASRTQKDKPSYAARFPDVFDAEESENEFFTANSYSDTETSTESLGGLTINASFPSHRGSISCSIDCDERFFEDISTDDEISVVFSTGPYGRNNESRRGTSRTLGRRYNRGTPHRQLQAAQEVVSLSPDPVEQVRQVEEDERMARMLQAQFDAEVDPSYNPPPNLSLAIHEDSDDEDEVIDPVADSDSETALNSFPTYPYLPISPPRGFRINRFPNRPGTPNSVSSGVFFTNRSRNRRRSHFPNRERSEWQIARLFGIGFPPMPSLELEDDYETLLSLDLSGDVVPRGLPRSEINRLPTRKYVHPNSASSASGSEVTHKRTELNKECQVCLTDYETGDVLRILPCFHEFHTPCIDPWLKINHSCPVCRVTVDLDA